MSLNAKEEMWVRKQVMREDQQTASQSELIEALEAGKWIPVTEKLPNPESDWVLVYADGAVNCMGYSKHNGFTDWVLAKAHNIDPEQITHWMPLPDPPDGF